MKKIIMSLVLFFLIAAPVGSVNASPSPLEGILIVDTGYFGFGVEPSPDWTLMTNAGSGGSFAMGTILVGLYDDPSSFLPQNYVVQRAGDTIHMSFDITQDSSRYRLELSGPSTALDTYYVSGSIDVTAVPVPGTLLLLGSGLAWMTGLGRKIRRA